ncbi:sarcosine oxidase subunit alpha family protein [Acuticoccus mangrovi]|uniref:Sarcosine oxidase subunit alpha family protein n=1 Tax=Acuticoccus mangrovi TaxID=2796142 RepID=A0A934IG29_9HYPH|nr:sarcosine oxidase subunit alpha family protein [Acuticoccus mangrovi]MBJ3775818.1 sarcosine oxidase subunit alpha family protein [Acuticoccus mangrovi]
MTGYRLATGGSGIDRTRRLGFTFAGRPYGGLAGDTLASALIANGVGVVGRSFKYHRPRGVTAAGPEEAGALVSLGEGGRHEPNAKAPMVPLVEGLVADGQNAWPSLGFDVGAINGLAGPLISAGFYYKTFIGGPRGTWTRLFEPVIRRAAGMGRAATTPDPDRYETMNATCDVLVIGAGPAGLMAATAALAAGARVILADERERPGGALLHDLSEVDGVPAPDFAAATAARLTDGGAVVLPRTTVYGHYDGRFGAVERVVDHPGDPHGLPRQRHWQIRARHVVLATGAIERPIVFPGNDRPGVMLADAARAYANRYGVAVGRRVAVFAAHDGAYRTVRDLAAAGIDVAAVVDARPAVPAAAASLAEAAGARLFAGHHVGATRGRKGLAGLTVAGADGGSIAVDALLVSGGYTPTLHLASQAGARPQWDDALAAFRPGPLPEGWTAAGAVTGRYATTDALETGAAAGEAAAAALGRTVAPLARPALAAADDAALTATAPAAPFHVAGKKAFVDLEHDVTSADIALAHDEGFQAVEHLKRYTTLGMATDQGKTSNVNGLAIMAEHLGAPIPTVGTTRFRPPYTPVALGALAGAETGAHVRPTRLTPMHDWHATHGAVFVATGAWLRPRAYLRPGEGVREAYIREAATVRTGVGIVDVSSLGKIEVAGPDAATLLDRVYANGFAKLPVGRARYGVMLREDGVVFDDGTTWRLGETRFLMTTTTANAAAVLSHLEVLLATAWPDLRVHVTSTTEQWAGMAVAGPLARTTLAATVAGIDFANEAFPFMAVREGAIGEVPVIVARLSFSGELAYEVYCGAHHGAAVWERIMAAGAVHEIAPYGVEALGTLRIEKGHVSGPELDGRTTLYDLGLERMASAKKAFVGSVLMRRPALRDPARKRFVGLVSLDGKPIRSGAHLVGPSGRSEGHVTSTTHSPALAGAEIALALLSGGPDRIGEELLATDPVRGNAVPVRVADPLFFDKDGSRMHV